MEIIEGKTYTWNFGGLEQCGVYTGQIDDYDPSTIHYIMKNEKDILWSVDPKYIIEPENK